MQKNQKQKGGKEVVEPRGVGVEPKGSVQLSIGPQVPPRAVDGQITRPGKKNF